MCYAVITTELIMVVQSVICLLNGLLPNLVPTVISPSEILLYIEPVQYIGLPPILLFDNGLEIIRQKNMLGVIDYNNSQ